MDATFQITDILNALVTLAVGLVALLIFKLQKADERQNAARIIVADVRHAEQVVLSMLERNHVDTWSKDLTRENNWAKYKHIFAGVLSSDDLVAFNRFFLAAAQMSDALARMREIHYAGLDEKSRIAQQKLAELPMSDEVTYQDGVNAIMAAINRSAPLFEPNEPRARYFMNLQQMGRLSTTPGFSVLRKIAKDM